MGLQAANVDTMNAKSVKKIHGLAMIAGARLQLGLVLTEQSRLNSRQSESNEQIVIVWSDYMA